jgi:hypothetical protein
MNPNESERKTNPNESERKTNESESGGRSRTPVSSTANLGPLRRAATQLPTLGDLSFNLHRLLTARTLLARFLCGGGQSLVRAPHLGMPAGT